MQHCKWEQRQLYLCRKRWYALLVDTGISKKRIEEGLKTLGIKRRRFRWDLNYSWTLGSYSRIRSIQQKIWDSDLCYAGNDHGDQKLFRFGKMPEGLYREIRAGWTFELGDMTVKPFAISHDANEPSGYRLEQGGKSVAVATILENTTAIQSNVWEILMQFSLRQTMTFIYWGRRSPYYLKQRILGDRDIYQMNCQVVCFVIYYMIIWNISCSGIWASENNYAKLAYETVKLEVTLADNEYKGDDLICS